jgi:hypothetical protein
MTVPTIVSFDIVVPTTLAFDQAAGADCKPCASVECLRDTIQVLSHRPGKGHVPDRVSRRAC